MSMLTLLGVVPLFLAARGGAAYAIGYILAIVLIVVVLPVWLIRRRRNRR